MMSIDEQDAFWTEQSDLFGHAAPSGPQASYLRFANLFQAYSARVMQGMLRWRHSREGLVEAFLAALAHATTAAEFLSANPIPNLKNPWEVFDFPHAGIASFLVLGETDQSVLRLVPSESSWSAMSKHQTYFGFETGILLLLNGSSVGPGWNALIAKCSADPRLKLTVDTYSTYRLLLERPSDASLLSTAEANFKRRARNGYYSGGAEIHGGGPDNAHTIDLLLEAIKCRIGVSKPLLSNRRQ